MADWHQHGARDDADRGDVADDTELVRLDPGQDHGFGLAVRRPGAVHCARAWSAHAARHPAGRNVTATAPALPVSNAAVRSGRPRATALTLTLALFLLLNGFALNALLRVVTPDPYKDTVLRHTVDMLQARGSDDSWGVMNTALEYLELPTQVPLYSEIFFNRKLRF